METIHFETGHTLSCRFHAAVILNDENGHFIDCIPIRELEELFRSRENKNFCRPDNGL